MDKRALNFRLKHLSKNKSELLRRLLQEAETGSNIALASAYLINELCPDDRTTKHVFDCLVNSNVDNLIDEVEFG